MREQFRDQAEQIVFDECANGERTIATRAAFDSAVMSVMRWLKDYAKEGRRSSAGD
jgi:hypothetical protein